MILEIVIRIYAESLIICSFLIYGIVGDKCSRFDGNMIGCGGGLGFLLLLFSEGYANAIKAMCQSASMPHVVLVGIVAFAFLAAYPAYIIYIIKHP